MEIYNISLVNVFKKQLGSEKIYDLGVFLRQSSKTKIRLFLRCLLSCMIISSLIMINFFNNQSIIDFLLFGFLVSCILFILFFIIFSYFELVIDKINVKSASIMAISDLVIILHISNNLDMGIEFLEKRDYHIISEVCRLSSNQANCSGFSLVNLFRDNLNQFVYFDVRNVFLDLLNRWEVSPSVSEDLRDKLARDYLDNVERGNRNVELIVSIYIAFGALLPQVTLIMLGLSGNLNLISFTGIILFLVLIIVFIPVNIIFDDDTEETFRLKNSPISPSALAGFLGYSLKKGMTLEEGMIGLYSTVMNAEFPGKEQINEIIHNYFIGWEVPEVKQEHFGKILCGKRGSQIISSYHRFAQLNTFVAGKNLIVLSKILRAQEKSASNRMIYVQSEYKKLLFLCVISSFTLGLLLACIPMFSVVAAFIKTSRIIDISTESPIELISDPSYSYVFLINCAISLLPARLRNSQSFLLQKGNIANLVILNAIFLLSSLATSSYSSFLL